MGRNCLGWLLGCFALVNASMAQEAPPAVPPPPTFAELAKRAALVDMAISPNGKLLAASIPVDSARNMIGVMDLETRTVKFASQMRLATETYTGFMWVNDSYLLLTLGSRAGGFTEPLATGELATFNVENGRLKYVFGYRGDMQTGSRIDKAGGEMAAAFPLARVPGGNKALIEVSRFGSGENAGIRELDVSNGRNKRVNQSPVHNAQFVVDHDGEVRIAYGGTTVEQHRVHVRTADGKWRLFEDAAQSKRLLYPVFFARDNNHFYAQVTRPKAPDALVKINMEDASETKVYASDIADPGRLIETFDGKDIAGVVTGEGKPGVHWLQSSSPEARLSKAMSGQMPDHLVIPVSSSDDGQKVIMAALSDRNAGDYYLYDRESRKADFIMARRSWLSIDALAKSEPISLKSRDGLDLHGFLTLPNQAQERPPLVVMPHGGPHGTNDRDDGTYNADVQALATRGFAVLQINFRGTEGYGDYFEAAGYRQWGRKMQDDVTDATRWAIESGKVNPEKVSIYGASYGGYSALMGAAREPDLYRCAISYVGVTDLPMMYSGEIDDTRYGRSYLQLVLGEDKAELEANSPSRLAAQIKAKVLLIHGAKDERVPLKHATLMRDALKAAGNEAQWYVEEDETHGFVKEAALERLYTRVDGFLRSCLN